MDYVAHQVYSSYHVYHDCHYLKGLVSRINPFFYFSWKSQCDQHLIATPLTISLHLP